MRHVWHKNGKDPTPLGLICPMICLHVALRPKSLDALDLYSNITNCSSVLQASPPLSSLTSLQTCLLHSFGCFFTISNSTCPKFLSVSTALHRQHNRPTLLLRYTVFRSCVPFVPTFRCWPHMLFYPVQHHKDLPILSIALAEILVHAWVFSCLAITSAFLCHNSALPSLSKTLLPKSFTSPIAQIIGCHSFTGFPAFCIQDKLPCHCCISSLQPGLTVFQPLCPVVSCHLVL